MALFAPSRLACEAIVRLMLVCQVIQTSLQIHAAHIKSQNSSQTSRLGKKEDEGVGAGFILMIRLWGLAHQGTRRIQIDRGHAARVDWRNHLMGGVFVVVVAGALCKTADCLAGHLR